VLVIGAAADQIFGHVEGCRVSLEPADDLLHLGHDFGADAVAGRIRREGFATRVLLGKVSRFA
jgi:hypothetical protein